MNRRIKKYFFGAVFLAPILGAMFSSCWPAARTAYALVTFESSKHSNLKKSESVDQTKMRRAIQRYLSDHSTYVPLEDIEWHSYDTLVYAETGGTMQNPSDRARLLVWVPLRFKLPFVGEKVVEWCWKPQIKAA